MHQNDDRLLPLTIAVTGHRDILPDETARIRSEFEQFMRRMAAQVPGMTLKVLSGAATVAFYVVEHAAGTDLFGFCLDSVAASFIGLAAPSPSQQR